MKAYFEVEDKFIPAHQLVANIIDLCALRGVDQNRLLRGTAIFIDDIASGDLLLSPAQILKLTENARQLTPGNDLSFLLGRRLFPGNYGALPNAISNAKNLHQMLRILRQHRTLISPFIHCHTRYANGNYYIIFKDAIGLGEQYQFYLELYLTGIVATCKLLYGKRLPFFFTFPFNRPNYIQEYEENLGHRLSFKRQVPAMWFEQGHLRTLNPNFSQLSMRHSLKSCRAEYLDLGYKAGFIEAVRMEIRRRLQQDNSLNALASHFSMSPATFKRKLKAHQFNFKQLQDEVKKDAALFLIALRNCTNEEVANYLQFTDIPNFRRAFKRWTGLTPSEFKSVKASIK